MSGIDQGLVAAELAAMTHAHGLLLDERDALTAERDRYKAALERIAEGAERNGVPSVYNFARKVLRGAS